VCIYRLTVRSHDVLLNQSRTTLNLFPFEMENTANLLALELLKEDSWRRREVLRELSWSLDDSATAIIISLLVEFLPTSGSVQSFLQLTHCCSLSI
jgi:hypothetical protein